MEGRHISLEPTQQIQTKVKVSGTPSHRTGTLFTAISAICYGATPILIKVQFAYGQPTSSTLSYRLFFSMIMIALLAVAGRFSLRVSRNDIVRFLYVGLAGAIGLLLLGAALARLDIGRTTALHYTSVMFVFLLSSYFLKIPLTKNRRTAVLLILLGIAVLAFSISAAEAYGFFLALLSGFFIAVYIVLVENIKFETKHPYTLAFYLNASILVYTLIYNVVLNYQRPINSAASFWYLLLFTLLNPMLGLAAFRVGVKLLGAARAGVKSTAELMIAFILGVLLLGEPINVWITLGVLFIMGSAVLANVQFFRRQD
ncbi:MAG TPA: DMT family transporter [Fastidiosipila sp.]|nr:DMT family transporter [Fastidiosipila sp.]